MTGAADRGVSPRKVLVAGLGNPDRCDDGVGAMVAQNLVGRLPPDVALLTRRGDMISLIDDCAGFDALVCVDAAGPMTAPGRISRIDLATSELPQDSLFMSSHAFGLAEAIALARTLQIAPKHIIVYAVEGCCFEGGAPMTPEVAAAAFVVADFVVGEVGRLRALSGRMDPSVDKKSLQIQKLEHILVDQIESI
ncbi:MAG: hydrogenase maturation protease [Methylocella sp.]